MVYSPVGPFVNGQSPAINATFLNAVESELETLGTSLAAVVAAVVDASQTVKGLIEIGTEAEVLALADGTKAVTPPTLAAALLAYAVLLTGDQSIAGNKTFTGTLSVPDNNFSISDTNGLTSALAGKADDADVTSVATDLATLDDELRPTGTFPTNIIVKSGGVWPARPETTNIIGFMGADPDPTDMEANDYRIVTG